MEITHANNDTFESEVLENDKPVLVDFYADWCGPCKMLAPTIEELADEYADRIKVVKVNIDEADEVAANYAVMSIPTLILFKNGEDIKKTVGVMPKERLVKEFEL